MLGHPSTVFSWGLVSNDITSFQPLCQLGVCVGRFPAPSGVRISRCFFFFFFFLQTFTTFFRVVLVLMSGDLRPVLCSLLDS